MRIENNRSHVGLRITGDRPLESEALWSIRVVLAVEPFVKIHAAPSEDFSWSIKYTYFAEPTSR